MRIIFKILANTVLLIPLLILYIFVGSTGNKRGRRYRRKF